MKAWISDRTPDRRRDLARLRRMEIMEGLLEFDLASLQLYADSVAEERQFLTKQVTLTTSKR
jgi:hypothetical protein